MTKEEILKLENNQENYNFLHEFKKNSQNSELVFWADLKVAEILFDYEEYLLCSENLLELFRKNNSLEDKYYKLLIDSSIKSGNQEVARNFIQIRKSKLTQLKMYEYYLDLLLYKYTFGEEFYSLFSELKPYSFDKKILLPYYIIYFENLIDAQSPTTKEIYQEILMLNPDAEKTAYLEDLYFNFLIKMNEDVEGFISLKPEIVQVYYQMLILISENKLKTVQTLEAENEMKLLTLTYDRQQRLFKELKEFYELNKDFKSFELYQRREAEVIKKIKRLTKEIQKQKKLIIANEELVLEEVTTKTEKPKQKASVETLYLLAEFINDTLIISEKLNFSNRLRELGRLMEKYFKFSDILFYFKTELYHYKKERLYFKKTESTVIASSVVGITANNYEDIVGIVEEIKPDVDVLSEKPLTETTVKQVYCYGLIDQSSVCFYQRNKSDINHDDLIFKTLANFIAYEFKRYNQQENLKEKTSLLTDFFDDSFLTLFIYKDKFYSTKSFNDLFKLKRNDDLETLVFKFSPDQRIKYNNLLNAMTRGEIVQFEIDLFFDNKKYLALHRYNNQNIYGCFIDVTTKEKELISWQEKAFVNPLSELLTLHRFSVDFQRYSKSKTSFVLIEVDNLSSVEMLYGKEVRRNYFLEFIELAKEDFQTIYQFDENSIIAVLKYNDVRTVEQTIKRFINKVKNTTSKILKFQEFNCFLGIIRYPVNTKEKNVEKIYRYLSLALYKAKRKGDSFGFSYFDFQDYEQEVFETEMIKQIDQLIVEETLDLSFTQIINQESQKVFAYEIGVISETLNVYEDYYYKVAAKRGLIKKLERYIIEETFKKTREIHLETGGYLKTIINLSKESLNDENFVSFIVALFKNYSTPYEAIEFNFKLSGYKQKEYLKLKELASYGVVVGTSNHNYLKETFLKTFHFTDIIDFTEEKSKSYLKMINDFSKSQKMIFIVYNVDSQEEKNQLKLIGVNYIRGKVVDRKFTYKEILKMLKTYNK